MNEVEQLIYQRLTADTGTGSIVGLLGSTSRVSHSHQNEVPSAPGLTYGIVSSGQGQIPGRTQEYFVLFNIFADTYADIALRLKRLFDGHTHDLALISGGATQIGGVVSVFDFEGPDGFDESLQVQKKDLRFRFFVKPKSQNPI